MLFVTRPGRALILMAMGILGAATVYAAEKARGAPVAQPNPRLAKPATVPAVRPGAPRPGVPQPVRPVAPPKAEQKPKPAKADDVGPTPQEVEAAITKAKAFLYSKMKDGNWDGPAGKGGGHSQHGGISAIATYALLASGESHNDTRIKAAIDYLLQHDMQGIYAIGLRAQVWHLIPPGTIAKQGAAMDGKLLHDAAMVNNATKGMYRYSVKSKDYDHSCAQYGVLGMWSCAQTGFEVGLDYWKAVDAAWRKNQHDDGGWSYAGKGGAGRSTAPMTAAGVATLFITQDYLNQGRDMNCVGNITDSAIDRGLEWMSKNFDEVRRGRAAYTLYGVERIGVASGYKYFGTVDWYHDGAAYFVKNQQKDGSWGDVPNTCFGILFLVRGRAPVVMNKLQYTIDRRGDKPVIANWNQRPRDVANLSRWLSKTMERDLNWQIVNLNVAADELHDGPILFIAGNQPLVLSKQDKDKLKLYVEQGGIILGNADCARRDFADSFKKLGQELFPDYEWRDLPADHPIYTSQQFKAANWRPRPQLLGLGNGARELMLLLPVDDPARYWQMMVVGGREPLYELASNIFLYAIDKKDLRNKGETYIVKKDPKIAATKAVKVARLQYEGNWDPEPGGWRRLANIMHNEHQISLQADTVKLGAGQLVKEYAVAHLTGTAKFSLTELARKELADYVAAGGTLVVDAAGGSADFGTAAERELATLFPAPKAVLPRDHAVCAKLAGMEGPLFRPFARRSFGEMRSPRLTGIAMNGRTAAYYSAEDLSVGLVGQAVDGITGYLPQAATAIMTQIVLENAK